MTSLVETASRALCRLSAGIGVALTPDEVLGLLRPDRLAPIAARRRGAVVLSRVRLVAGLFAVLTPLWSFIDVLLFAWPTWAWLVGLRAGATLGFWLVARRPASGDPCRVGGALATLMAIPMLFFIASHPVVNTFAPGSPPSIIAAGYAFLPFVMVAGIAVFPLTALEAACLGLPILALHLVAGLWGSVIFPFASYLGAFWLLAIMTVVAGFAATSQLHFLTAFVVQSGNDRLTGALVRREGEELAAEAFERAAALDQPFALAFVDLDNFKEVNDSFGHEEGDRVLHDAAATLASKLRRGDLVVRWGGEEFLVVMPGARAEDALAALLRIGRAGLCARADGTRQTASFGLAERQSDGAPTLHTLIEVADRRMYSAKRQGRDRIVGADEQAVPIGADRVADGQAVLAGAA